MGLGASLLVGTFEADVLEPCAQIFVGSIWRSVKEFIYIRMTGRNFNTDVQCIQLT